MKEQTAVEWLIEFIIKHGLVPKETIPDNVIFHKAKEIEKKQIIDAWYDSMNSFSARSGVHYYDKNYKKD
jgi:hypothetical protein